MRHVTITFGWKRPYTSADYEINNPRSVRSIVNPGCPGSRPGHRGLFLKWLIKSLATNSDRALLSSSDSIPDFPKCRALRMVNSMCTPVRKALSIFTRKEVTVNVEQATVTDESASHNILWPAFSDLDNDYGKNITPKY